MSMLAPKIFEGLFGWVGEVIVERPAPLPGRCSFFALEERGKIDDADRNPNFAEFFGGRGGGVPSSEAGLCGFLGPTATLWMYF